MNTQNFCPVEMLSQQIRKILKDYIYIYSIKCRLDEEYNIYLIQC